MQSSTAEFNAQAMEADMVAKGWLAIDLAKAAAVSHMTVARFFNGTHRTPRTAKKLARALGRPLRHYMKSDEVSAVNELRGGGHRQGSVPR